MESLSISEPSGLDTVPTDILLIVLSYLDTARSVARLASTCKGLHRFIVASGWRIFVTACFNHLSLPPTESGDEWKELARTLTFQSRDWDKHAFVCHSLIPPEKPRPNGRRYRPAYSSQSIPANVMVDSHVRRQGRNEEELVVWGAGEDVFARVRQKQGTEIRSETWETYKGSQSGHSAGKGDITHLSILKGTVHDESDSSPVLVGRANGDLRLLSMEGSNFGSTLMQFRPSSTAKDAVDQNEIQSFDYSDRSGMLAAGTRENVLFYSLGGEKNAIVEEAHAPSQDMADPPFHEPTDAVVLKNASGSTPFEFVRSAKFMDQNTLAISLNRSASPVQFLTLTSAGIEVSAGDKLENRHHPTSGPRTVRALLPIDDSSVAHGGGKTLLSSWDDGTIRLQDIRTPSPTDRIYQDNFEVAIPINALISYGLERFIAGSAYSHLLKIFDYRMSKGYYHTEALPCGNNKPYPTPKPPTVVKEPFYPDNRTSCDYLSGRSCRWHALSRHDFFRPNCNIYLPMERQASSPIYSLTKPSDASSTIYAGLSGELAEVTLKSGIGSTAQPATKPLYSYHKGKVAILETGDGGPIWDISKCQRVPDIYRQSFGRRRNLGDAGKRHRLDEWYWDP